MAQTYILNQSITQSLGLSSLEIYHTCSALLKELHPEGSVLDFGSGKGQFLKLAYSHNFRNLTGTDIMPRPADLPSEISWTQADLNQEMPFENESFDVVVALEVIEHLENPRHMIRVLNKLLKPGGFLILSTPNNHSWRSILSFIIKGHFVSFLEKDYPAHITALTKIDLRRLVEEQNLRFVRYAYVPKGNIPGMKGLTWQKVSGGLLKGERYSDNIFIVARKV